MPEAIINANECKGCGLCVTACPKKIVGLAKVELNKKGFHPAVVTDPEKCIGCAMCAMMCPDVAITVSK